MMVASDNVWWAYQPKDAKSVEIVRWNGSVWLAVPSLPTESKVVSAPCDPLGTGAWIGSPDDAWIAGWVGSTSAMFHFDGTAWSTFEVVGALPGSAGGYHGFFGSSCADNLAIGGASKPHPAPAP